MKTFILSATLISMGLVATAQNAIEQSRFTDNVSATVKGGAVTPLNSSDFWGNMRGAFGLDLRKQITPAFGMGVEGAVSVNTSSWYGLQNKNAFEHQLVGAYGSLNLMNLFGGYNGYRRAFEIEAVAGVGWLHYYSPDYDSNSWYTRAGLNLNFNFGNDRQWTLALMPSVVWNMNGNTHYGAPLGFSAQYSSRQAALQLFAGITYHFGNSNGTRNFALVRPYDYEEAGMLNEQVNALRAQLEASMAMNVALEAENITLAQDLEKCADKKPEVKVVTDSANTLNTVRYIFFRQGRSTISAYQLPNVEQIAAYLKKHPAATVVIKGYASPEGSAEVNARIAKQRAESVKKSLVSKYKIAASRISADGQGIGEMFSEPDWNRVSVCTIEER